MTKNKSVLALGAHGAALSRLAERARALDFRVVRAQCFEDATALSRRRNLRYGPVLIDPFMPISNLAQAVDELRDQSLSPDLVCIAVGPRPEPKICEWLRRSGVRIALWEPVGDHALRFQLNRAMSAHPDDAQRGALRTPTEWSARVFVGGREKPAVVYSLSDEGAFLETWRPSVAGAEIALELPLPDGAVTIGGEVVYTNVPGNLQCQLLPVGMAVRFNDAPKRVTSAISESVSQSVDHYSV